jgi:hypothetical protein
MIMTDTGPTPIDGDSPCVLHLGAETSKVERQNVTFAFRGAPSTDTIRAIEERLREILQRVA